MRVIRATALMTAALAVRGAAAQAPQRVPIEIAIGTLRTVAEQTAARFLVDVSKRFSGLDFQANQRRSLIYWTPDLRVEVGDHDAFSSVIARVTGSYLRFRTVDVEGITTPDSRFFHSFPFSAGVETDRAFRNINALVEAGYVPWFLGEKFGQLRSLQAGVFVQAGYKSLVDTAGTGAAAAGGNTDQSSEPPDSWLMRVKASLRFAPSLRLSGSGQGVGLNVAAHAWYDAANDAGYNSLDLTARLSIDARHHFDLTYQKGSGAPLFNKGEQWSANLTFVF